jgi:hypothetical protein
VFSWRRGLFSHAPCLISSLQHPGTLHDTMDVSMNTGAMPRHPSSATCLILFIADIFVTISPNFCFPDPHYVYYNLSALSYLCCVITIVRLEPGNVEPVRPRSKMYLTNQNLDTISTEQQQSWQTTQNTKHKINLVFAPQLATSSAWKMTPTQPSWTR